MAPVGVMPGPLSETRKREIDSMKVINELSRSNSGTNSATVTIPPQDGLVVGRQVTFTSPGAGTLTIYCAQSQVIANAAVSAGTTLVIDTDSNGYVDGAVLTTNDYVLVFHPTTGAATLSAISVVGSVSSSTVSLTLGTAITCSEDDKIYVVRAAGIETHTVAAETVRGLDYFYAGMAPKMPVHMVLAATGTCRLSTFVQVKER